MRRFSRTTGERGFSSLELTLAMPLIVFSILFLIGMGHVLITKQHAMVGAQFAANHHRVKEAGPSAAQVGQSVSAGTEVFRLDGGGDEEISYTASTTPERGLIAEKYRPTDAVSKYQTLTGTGACEPDCTPLVAVTRIISVEMIAGIIFSGNDEGLANITDAVGGIGGKGRGRNRGGAPGQANGRVDEAPGVVAGVAGDGRGNGPKGGGNGESGGTTGQAPAGGGSGSPPRKKPPAGDENNHGGNDERDNNPNGNATLPPPSRQPGEGIATKRPLQWGDPKSTAYGHSRSEHGSQRPPQQLKDRARTTGKPQGQYYDNSAIVEAEQRAPTEPGIYEIELGRPIGRVYMPDGTIKENVTRVRVVRRADGTIRTSFPIE